MQMNIWKHVVIWRERVNLCRFESTQQGFFLDWPGSIRWKWRLGSEDKARYLHISLSDTCYIPNMHSAQCWALEIERNDK